MKNPIQPFYTDSHGVVRFKPNKIIRYLLDSGAFDLNTIARLYGKDDDYAQLMQLIGYSFCGFCEVTEGKPKKRASKKYERYIEENPVER